MAKLFLFYHDLAKEAPAIAALWKIGAKEQKPIEDLDDMVKAIGQHKALDELVILAHGYSGGLILDKAYTLSDPAVSKAFAKKTTKIEHIRFEGCWVGEAPDEMAKFGLLFDALDVSGFTWAHWQNEITVTIPKQASLKALQGVMKDFEKWLAPAAPSMVQLSSMAKHREIKQNLPMEWYQYSLDIQPPYAKDQSGKSNFQKLGSHRYKVRAEAEKREVKAKDAKRSDSPIPPFQYVTVKVR